MKLGTRLLVFSSIFLALLPWLGFHFVQKIEQSLLQGQEEAQLMVASAISSVLNGYTDIFNVDKNALYVYPLVPGITVDGYDEDWRQLSQQATSYAGGVFSVLLSGDVALNEGQYLYAFLKVNDKDIVYRNPRYASLDSSDHIRLEYLDASNRIRRLVLSTEGQGNIRFHEVNSDWRTEKPGSHVRAAWGVWQETDYGYDLELQIPSSWIRTTHTLSLSVVDVFSENERYPDTVASTRNSSSGPNAGDKLNSLLFQSPEIGRVIHNLSRSDSQICIVDKYRRVRAVTGGQEIYTSFCHAIDKVSNTLLDEVLQGSEQVVRYLEADENLIVAGQPVFDDQNIIGAVLVSKNSRQILALQRDTLRDIAFATLLLFFLVFVSLLLFSSWLAFRINRLKKQTAKIIDEHGRFISHIDLSDSRRRDEIGDLSRSFSSLLDKLNSYTQFLETVPRMLRHEILNPVNTISMSLQNLQQPDTQHDTGRDIETAGHAVRQLQLIVSGLTEAANIDDALIQDESEVFDIAALLSEYVRNSQRRHTDAKLRYQGVTRGVFITGNDIRIVQLLDKLKDNALDFAWADTEIVFQLEINQQNQLMISVKNEGELIEQQQLENIFRGMNSYRKVKAGVPHLGVGLYVANKIAEYHQGQLHIANRTDKQGVEVVLIMPIVCIDNLNTTCEY